MRHFLLFLLVFAASAMADNTGAPARSNVIEIQKFAFSQKEITVAPGATVTWINRDEVPHNIVGGDRAFVSKALDTGDRFDQVFEHEGDYTYACALHPFMTGIVHVRRQ